MTAAMLPMLIGAVALAVDVGSLYLERRQAQGAADLGAIAGAGDITNYQTAATKTIAANKLTYDSLVITRGYYIADSKRDPSLRFSASPIVGGPQSYNAVRVEIAKPGRIFFSKAFRSSPVDMRVTATAASVALASFSIGSRLAAVRDGIPNKLLGGLLKGNVNLTAMDYDSLINADVRMDGFLNALASQLSLTGVTYNQVLNADAKAGDVFKAAAVTSNNQGNSAVSATLSTLASQAGSASLSAPLSAIMDVGPLGNASIGQAPIGLDSTINVMDLVSSTAGLANVKNQVSLDLAGQVPGLLSLKVDLAVGERAQQSEYVAVGDVGATVSTAQTRLRLVAEVGGSGLLAGTKVRLPLAVDLAYATGTLTNVSCSGDPSKATATVAAGPGLAKAWIGELSDAALTDFSTSPAISQAKIVDTLLIKVKGSAAVTVANTSPTSLDFTLQDVANKTIKRVETTNLTNSLVTSLLQNLSLSVDILGLGLGTPSAIQSLVASILGTVATPLDQVVSGLLSALGVHLGEVDVRMHGIRCGAGVLVN
jgi:tight adherence protein G